MFFSRSATHQHPIFERIQDSRPRRELRASSAPITAASARACVCVLARACASTLARVSPVGVYCVLLMCAGVRATVPF
eukprot:scaffold141968_cov42-Tisochrysis_lutea.AAC.3